MAMFLSEWPVLHMPICSSTSISDLVQNSTKILFIFGRTQLWSNATDGRWANLEIKFESHWTLASWQSGPFIQFKERALHATQ